jgi:hypothetical protein
MSPAYIALKWHVCQEEPMAEVDAAMAVHAQVGLPVTILRQMLIWKRLQLHSRIVVLYYTHL